MIYNVIVRFSFIFFFLTSTHTIIYAAEKVVFSQEVIAYDETGNPYPAIDIDPGNIDGMRQLEFDIGNETHLVVKTNLLETEHRGLPLFVDTIKKCSYFIEERTGRNLSKDILIFIIELDSIPRYYRFQASYSSYEKVRWGEVRLVLLSKDDTLYGKNAPKQINEFLFDTLPHELSHDVLGNIPTLHHDIDGKPSFHTRWFIEGICELLAKEFSYQEAPYLWKYFLKQRNVFSIMNTSLIPNQIFTWSQNNNHSMDLESNLYGAAFLILKSWTAAVSLKEILYKVVDSPFPLPGSGLVSLMQKTAGLSKKQSIERAALIGTRLAKNG